MVGMLVSMLGDGGLAFTEFAMGEELPLATLHAAVLAFLRDRDDLLLFGAQAVNAYVDDVRMTQDVDVLALDARSVAESIREHLAERFRIAVRVRDVSGGLAFRVDQLRQPSNRHLVDVRETEALPAHERVAGVLVLAPHALVAAKVISAVARAKTAKGLTDLADLRRLLLRFPELKSEEGLVAGELARAGASAEVLARWRSIVAEEILPDDDD